MARVTKRKSAKELEPYWYNEDISVIYEIEHASGLIKPGTLIKIKNDRSIYKFRCLVVNSKTGVEWLDVLSAEGYGWSSFHPSRLVGIFVAKRSRAKKAKAA